MKFILKFVIVLIIISSQANATRYKKTKLGTLVKNSTLVLDGTVISTESKWSGKNITTTVFIDIVKIHKGEFGKETIELTLMGGRVADSEMIVHGNPNFKVNEKVFLLLVFHRGSYWLNSMGMGKFNILEENKSVFLENKNVAENLITSPNFNSKSAGHPKFFYDEVNNLIKNTKEEGLNNGY